MRLLMKLRLTQLVRPPVLLCAVMGFLAAQPSLKITTPADETIVHPGDLLTVTVDVSPATGAFQHVSVIGATPIESSKETLNAPPYQFTIQVPMRTRPNGYQVTAVGSTLPGHLVNSNPITILVERADLPVRLFVEPTTLVD